MTPKQFFSAKMLGGAEPFSGDGNLQSRSRTQRIPDLRPNLLLLIPDQHRSDFSPWNESVPVRMPHVAGLAQRGLRFDQAIVNCPLCAPSRAGLASGRSYGSCGVVDNFQDYPLGLPTFYQQLRSSGYEVCGTGKFDLHKNTSRWGLDGSRLLTEWGFTQGIDNEGKWDGIRTYRAHGPQGPYFKFLEENGLAGAYSDDFERRGRDYTDGHGYGQTFPTDLPDYAYCDNWIGRNTIDILRGLPEEKPWFMQVNFTGPHEPQDITNSMWQACQGLQFPGPVASSQHDADFHNRARQNYSAMLENIDARIGEILAAVARRGELDNTVVIYTSDHGEMLGDHNEWQKSRPWQSAIGVPLVAAGPGIAVGEQGSALVQLTDLAATFIDYADASELPEMDSRSIRPVLEDPARSHREIVFSSMRNSNAGVPKLPGVPTERTVWDCAFDGRYKAIHQSGRGLDPQLFNLDKDPGEEDDLAASNPGQLASLLSQIDAENARVGK